MAVTDKILATVILLMSLLKSVECLKCVRCSSITERACLRGDLMPKNCSEDHIYCIKYESSLNNGKFVVRDCAGPGDDKTGCTMKTVENQRVKVCVSTCTTDGCNKAPLTHPAIAVFLLIVIGIILIHCGNT